MRGLLRMVLLPAVIGLGWLTVEGSAIAAATAAGEDVLEIEVRLLGALGSGGDTSLPALLLDLTRTGERWERVWGVHSNNRKPSLYTGCVRRAEVGGDRVAFEIQMWRKDLSGIEMDLKRAADGELLGTYTVNAGTNAVKGRADGRIKPKRPALPAGVTSASSGERPRIVVRASDIPSLKKKLETAAGKAAFEKMGDEKTADAIGQGLKYALTGDKQYAEKAMVFAEKNMTGNPGGYSMRSSAGRLPQQVALAYDFCCTAWPAEFRKKVEEYLANEGERCLRGRGFSGGYNWHVTSNWGSKVFQGAGFIGLALWGEKGPAPAKPDGADAGRLAEWEFDTAEWKRLGEADMRYQRIFEESRYVLYLFNREGIGTGGFRGECSHYGINAMEMQIEYASCYRRMFGSDLSPYADAALAMPRMMFCHYYPEDPALRPVALNINGLSGMREDMIAYGFPMVPEPWKGAMLWAWNRGKVAASSATKAGAPPADSDERAMAGGVGGFVNYPLDMKPQHPSACMPLTWQAPDHGFYGFRNSWKGQGDFVLLVHAKTHSPGGWNGPNVGTFRLFGLGQSWNETYEGREICPWEENRVILPEDPFSNSGLGRVVQTSFEPDGSGSVTINMDDAYNPPAGRPYSMYGSVREAQSFTNASIRALRAIAVDYSGKSGAPCLFVLADRISGGKSKLWTWNLGDATVVPKVAVAANGFTIPRAGGTLHGMFVTPRPVTVTARINDGKDQQGHNCGQRDKTPPRKVPTLFAEARLPPDDIGRGGQGGDEFFLVATVQDGKTPPPEIKVEGEGLGAKVTVGRRRVAFDGTKILISDAP